jgi:hypothetical protein
VFACCGLLIVGASLMNAAGFICFERNVMLQGPCRTQARKSFEKHKKKKSEHANKLHYLADKTVRCSCIAEMMNSINLALSV